METQFDDGQRVTGTPYVVRSLLGGGGMGSVYRVEHVELGKAFVLKVLHRHLGSRPDLVARMRNEWSALARLSHPNIVQVNDAGYTACGLPYFVMEHLEGRTLGQLLAEEGKLEFRAIGEILVQVLDALYAAHQTGAIHRDVKPHNIFLGPGGTVKLLDFGIAKLRDQAAVVVTVGGVSIGTPRYMAPEQAEGSPVDGRADVYSVALVLYESLVGHGPFAHIQDPNELVMAHIDQEPDRVDHLDAGIPPEVSDLVQRWLSKSAHSRPANASLAARELRALLQAMAPLDGAEDAASITLGGRFDASTVGVRRVSGISDQVRVPQLDSPKGDKTSDQVSDASSAANPLAATQTVVDSVPRKKRTLGWGTHTSRQTLTPRSAAKTSRSMTPPPSSSERPPSRPSARIGWVLLIAATISFGISWTMLRVAFPPGQRVTLPRDRGDSAVQKRTSQDAAPLGRLRREGRVHESLDNPIPIGRPEGEPLEGVPQAEPPSGESRNRAAASPVRESAVPNRAPRTTPHTAIPSSSVSSPSVSSPAPSASQDKRIEKTKPTGEGSEDLTGEGSEDSVTRPSPDFPGSGLW